MQKGAESPTSLVIGNPKPFNHEGHEETQRRRGKSTQKCLCHKIADLEKAKKKDWRSRRAIPVLHEVLLI